MESSGKTQLPPRPASPIFVVGSGRSGTTLVRALLSAHTGITIAPETHFLKRAEREEGRGAHAPSDFVEFWSRFREWPRFKTLGVDEERCLELIEGRDDRTFRGIFDALLTAFGERTGKRRVGEKSPSHVLFIDRLLTWYPDGRIVVMRRDPRAVVSSELLAPWMEPHITGSSLRRGLLANGRLRWLMEKAEHWRTVYEVILPRWQSDPRVLTVDYEDLVTAPEDEVRRICVFLDEEYEGGMLTDRTEETVPPPAADQWEGQVREGVRSHHARSRDPISTDSLEKWRERLSGLEVALVEAHCRRGMEAAGHTFEAGRLARRVAPATSALGEGVLGLARAEEWGRKRVWAP